MDALCVCIEVTTAHGHDCMSALQLAAADASKLHGQLYCANHVQHGVH